MKIEQPARGRMVFNSCSGLDSLQLQRKVHNVERGELLVSVSFSQALSEEPLVDQDDESPNNSFDDQFIEKSE